MRYKTVRGMEDILPPDVGVWQELERRARVELEFYGYREIRTPILESTPLFTRSIGEASDIVTKEMFTFKDRKERSLTLRPEGTAPIVRAYIEHSLDKVSPEAKLYYIGPMFRSERPQKGRLREFHQIGAEVFGASASFDGVFIFQLNNLLKVLGLEDFTIKLNSLGCKKCKNEFSNKLKTYLEKQKNGLCPDCKERIKENVLRTLDCKNEACRAAIKTAPSITDHLCDECGNAFRRVKSDLDAMGVRYREANNLVRGLDYYTGTVFEITHPALGAQDAIGAGGRYDTLVKDLGGPGIPAIGYALGFERVIIALKKDFPKSGNMVIYIASLDDRGRIEATQIGEKIKEVLCGKAVVLTDVRGASLKAQMRSADKQGAAIALILSGDELEKGKITIKDMTTGKQELVDKDKIVEKLQ